MGLLDEARITIARLRALTPEVIPTYLLPYRASCWRYPEASLFGGIGSLFGRFNSLFARLGNLPDRLSK